MHSYSEYLIVSLAALFILDCITTHQILKRGGREMNGLLAKLIAAIGVDEALGLSKIIVLVFVMALYINHEIGAFALIGLNVLYVGIVCWNARQLWGRGLR